jgi:hypothetical protein
MDARYGRIGNDLANYYLMLLECGFREAGKEDYRESALQTEGRNRPRENPLAGELRQDRTPAD